MALTKQQFEQSGLKLINWEGGTQIIGAPGTPYARAVDPQTLQYLSSIGVTPTQLSRVPRPGSNPMMNETIWVDPSGAPVDFDWNTSGGTTFTMPVLERTINHVASLETERVEAERGQNLNAFIDKYRGSNTTIEIPQELQPQGGNYIIHNGVFKTRDSVSQEEILKAKVASGEYVRIGGTDQAPLYAPKGSAADLQAQGKTQEQQLATPSVQQQIQQQGLTPQAPNPPVAAPTGGPVIATDTRPASALTPAELAARAGVPESELAARGIVPGAAQAPAPTPGSVPPPPGTDVTGADFILGKHSPGLPGYAPTPEEKAKSDAERNMDEINKLNENANGDQEKEAGKIEAAGITVDVSKSADLSAALVKALETSAPAKPDLTAKLTEQRAKLGVGKLEDDLASADLKIKKLDADYLSTLSEEEQRQVSMGQIKRRQTDVDVKYQRQRRDLAAERSYVADSLNMKLGTLNTMMSLTGKEYDMARGEYEFAFNKSISVANLFRGIQQDALTMAEKRQDNARANVQIISDLLKAGNLNLGKLSESAKLDIKNMEIQAGLPVGFTAFVSKTVKDETVSFLTAFTDASGKRIQPIATKKADGTYSITNVELGAAETGGDKILSQDKINKLAAAGIPEIVSKDIQASLNAGFGLETIRRHLAGQFGQDQGYKYLDSFMGIVQDSGDDPVGFRQVSGDTNLATTGKVNTSKQVASTANITPGSVPLPELKNSIIAQESGGNYLAVGIQTKHGKALGKYQVVPKFWFSKIGLNPTSAKDQQKFLKDRALQDKTFGLIMDQLDKKYNGDPRKIAAAYYGGDTAVKKLGTKAGDVRQQGGKAPSINEYVNQVMSRIKTTPRIPDSRLRNIA